MPTVPAKPQSVPTVKDFKEASEVISALKCVYLDSETTVAIADKTDNIKAEVFGVAITAGNIGEEVEIVNYGQIDDAFFLFPVNATLFLGTSGTITTTPPGDGEVRTIIGKSLGIGSIFVNISEPILPE